MNTIELTNLPRRIAITMDGNGRWAELRGKPRIVGHRAGSHTVRRIVRACRRLGVQELTLYAFSEQNWGRPSGEVDGLMTLLEEFLVQERDEILQNRIHLRGIGNLERLPAHVRESLDYLSEASNGHQGMTLSLALSYGGREEIVDATRSLARQVAKGELNPDDITEDRLGALLPSMLHGPADLMIRTGGELRISNFLLWGAAYSELFFSDILWPDFQVEHLYQAIAAFQRRQRRFGLVPNSNTLGPCPTSLSGS
ncbi:MAG: Undecaprenyl diphosphate synthase [Myxococcaceae bacterium]|nr:Undecaprenyl diphosphate synthase [Myxococcaceae bacterium]